MDLKKLLNKEQYEAATTINGPLLILAGAGSGKTRVLTHRIAYMIQDLNIYPSSILAITFTNKAAGEMKERVRALVGNEANNMWVSTFHSSCVRILRREIDKLGYNKNFAIYDSSDQKILIKECMKELNINDKDITDRELLGKISDQKNSLISAEQFKRENEGNFKLNKIADVYLLYQKKLKSNNALDFDDLIFKTVELFKKEKEVLEFYQRKFKYIMVDEYQDTNRAQYELVKLLSASHRNICVVGDDDQCLPEGTLIDTPNGKINIENLKEGQQVLCASGYGEIQRGTIEKISKKSYDDVLIEVTTKSGRKIKATPNHITFSRQPEQKTYESSITEENIKCNILNLRYFSGEKLNGKSYCSHEMEFINLNKEGNCNTKSIEESMETYDEAEIEARKLASVYENVEIIRSAKLTEKHSYIFIPFEKLKQGMNIVVKDGDKLVEDTIEKVEFKEYKGYVYDLSIPEFRQYISNDMVVHNCIYQWRGADIRNILDFEKDYKEAKVVKLEQNYRSKANILNAANEVIRNNAQRKNKILRTQMEDGEKIKIYRAYSDVDEGMFVCKSIKQLCKTDNKKYKDFAILYRTNAQSRIFEDVLMKNAIPYRIIGGLKFYDRKEVKDILAYLKLINNPVDDVSLKRIINVPKRAIGDATVEKVQNFASTIDDCLYSVLLDVENVPGLSARNINNINKFVSLVNGFIAKKDQMLVSELIEEILDKTGYIDALLKSNTIEDKARIENLKELVSAAVEFENNSEDKSLFAFLEQVTLVADVDNFDQEADTVVLMTVHSAKGLEFPVVFMVGMENGIFPGMASLNDFSEMEESRRLCYVAITRAKEKLYVTSAESRRVFGRTVCYEESDFISEIPFKLKERVELSKVDPRILARNSVGENLRNNPHSLRNSIKSFNQNSYSKKSTTTQNNSQNLDTEIVEGRKVKHPKFGVGTVVGKKTTENGVKITVIFDNYGIKNLMLDKAALEVL